jgi:addiction module HigA family antidote
MIASIVRTCCWHSNQRATQNLFDVEGWVHMASKSSTITRNLMPLVTPGEILEEEFMAPFGLSANALGLELHVPPNRIQAIVKGERAITADTALRLSQYFGNSPEFWLNLQQNYDLDATKRDKLAEIQSQVPRRRMTADWKQNQLAARAAGSRRVSVRP